MATQYDGWSIVAQYRKCGKEGCKTCADGPRHGPYYYGTKTIDGKRYSKYFGKNLPSVDAQDDTQDMRVGRLEQEVFELRLENERLQKLVSQLQSQLEAYKTGAVVSVPVSEKLVETVTRPEIPTPRNTVIAGVGGELTRDQVEEMWRTQTHSSGVDDGVLQQAYESLMHGLFSDTQEEHTRLKRKSGRRPYVCPFRGPRKSYTTAERLVRTAIPWLIENMDKQLLRRRAQEVRDESERAEKLQRYEGMNTQALCELQARMKVSLSSGSAVGWAMSLEELKEHTELIEHVLVARTD